MKTKLSREQIFAMYYVLSEELLKGDKNNINNFDKWFSMATNRTLELIEPEIRNIMIARNTGVKEYQEYIANREEILKKYSIKDEKGQPVIVNGQYTFPTEDVQNNVTKELTELLEKNKDVIEKRNKEVQAYNEIIQEVIEVDVCTCSFKYFPNITPIQFEALKPMIKESLEELEKMS
jgi:signal recognition particle GTPase